MKRPGLVAGMMKTGSPRRSRRAREAVGLLRAINGLPNTDGLNEGEALRIAEAICAAWNAGRGMEERSEQPASQRESEKQLLALHGSLSRTLEVVERLQRPSTVALEREGFSPDRLKELLSEWEHAVHMAFGGIEGEPSRGAKPKIATGEVAEVAGHYFRTLTGRNPTITKDPATNARSGLWLNFLEAVFAALGIEASAPAQAEVVCQKIRSEEGI